MRNSILSRLGLLEEPPYPVMPLRAMCGSEALMCLGSGLMSEDCVIT